jgi:anti-sigma-K factor RskA
MFQQLQNRAMAWRWSLYASAAAHVLALCLFLRQPAPVFVRPQAVVAGAGGKSVTALYLPYDRGVHSEPAMEARVFLTALKSKTLRQKHSNAPLKADRNQPGDALQAPRAGDALWIACRGPE